MDRRQFIRRAGATGAVAAVGVAGLDGLAAADTPGPYPAQPQPYYDGTLAQQAADTAANNAAIGAALRAAGVRHVVVAMMENRSYDHLLSWLPGGDGRADMVYPAPDGNVYPNYPLGARAVAPDFQGCGYSDQDHSWEGWLHEHHDGALDGFLQSPQITSAGFSKVAAGANTFAIGWYGPEDIPAFAALAQNYTVCDRYFCSFAGETYPNRFYQHSGATDRDHNSGGPSTATIPAIWDQLTPVPGTVGTLAGKVTGAYYFKDVPFLALWGQKYVPFCRPFAPQVSSSDLTAGVVDGSKIPTDAANSALQPSLASGLGALSGTSFVDAVKTGALPNVAYIDPSFLSEGQGTSGDWHPLCDVRVGDAFIADIFHALSDYGPDGPVLDQAGNPTGNPSYLDSTLLIINFDEWGGFYDHVAPPKVTDLTDPSKVSHTGDTTTEGRATPDYTQLGFRGPTIVVSNLVPKGVSHITFDHSSVLALIESVFELTPVVPFDPANPTTVPAGAVGAATRDNFSNNIGAVATLSAPRTDRPAVPTSLGLAAAGRPIDGNKVPCVGPTAATSTPPEPLGTTSQYTQYGPATPPGLVSVPGAPTTGLPEVPLAVAAPLAAAALAGYALKKRFADDDRSSDQVTDEPV